MRYLFLLLLIPFCGGAFAQNDLLILKKNQRKVTTYYPGSEIDFSTADRYYEAYITSIKHDSLFLVQYDIRRVVTTVGAVISDTVSEYHFAVNYRSIISLGKKREGFDWNASGAALFGGGSLLTAAGLATWVFSKPNTRYYARPALVIGAAALAGVGYLLMHSGNKTMVLGKKYSLNYIKMT